MTLLSSIHPVERFHLTDAVRSVAWSAADRLIALGADGRARIDSANELTAPIGPDPIGCCWVTVDRVAVVDGALGVVVAGGGSVDVVPIDGALGVSPLAVVPDEVDGEGGDGVTRQRYCAAFGRDGLTVIHPDQDGRRPPTTIDTGPIRLARHAGGAIWLTGGADGLSVVDVSLACVDQRVELPGVVSLAVAQRVGRVIAADSRGVIHMLELSDLADGYGVDGYPDAVRLVDIAPDGGLFAACTDDEVTWWTVSDAGEVADQPQCSVGHDAPITACAIGSRGFLATGDHQGVVRLWSSRLRDLPVGVLQLDGEITVLSWSATGDRLAVGSTAGEVVVAELEAGEMV
ncbi:MAG: hypothetical protein AAGF91_12600 [Actinomycetota bacterium]